jgi:hypothetical protein
MDATLDPPTRSYGSRACLIIEKGTFRATIGWDCDSRWSVVRSVPSSV